MNQFIITLFAATIAFSTFSAVSIADGSDNKTEIERTTPKVVEQQQTENKKVYAPN